MLTLITGVPGSGKTAAAVDLLLREFKDRPLYVDGLEGLTLEHVEIDVLDWHQDVPDGAVVVVDEVQRKWRPRGPGAKVPESVGALETHRHRGLDFLLITQSPRLLDTNVRALIGRHVHIRDTGFMGRYMYEWPECSVDLAWKNCQNKRLYKLPKRVFDLYKSASLHTKPVRKLPPMLYLLAGAVLAAAGVGWLAYGKVKADRVESAALEPTVPARQESTAAAPPAASKLDEAGPVDERVDFMPRLSDRPWTAPAYDELRTVVHVPYVAGGICKGADCVCYTQDGATVPDMTAQACRDWVAKARPFNPYVLPIPVDTGAARSPSAVGRNVADPPPTESAGWGVPVGVSNPVIESNAQQARVQDLYKARSMRGEMDRLEPNPKNQL